MGNKPIKIDLHLEKTKYQAGDTIAGKVFLSANHVDKDISGVHLQLLGVEHVELREKKKNEAKNKTHRSTHTIIKSEYPLVNFGVVQLSPGNYEYKFNWEIPSELPGSMHCYCHDDQQESADNRGGFCEISYTLTAYVANKSSFTGPTNLERKSTVELHIIQAGVQPPPTTTLNQRQQPLVIEPNVFPINEYWIWDRGSIHLGFQLDKPNASPGETIQVLCRGQNQSRLEIEYISVKIVETVSWKTTPSNNNNNNNNQTDSTSRTLIEERQPVQAYEQWQPSSNKSHWPHYRINDDNEFNLTLPNDTRNTHATGRLIQVRHVLVVTVVMVSGVGLFCSTTTSPEMSCAIHVAPSSSNNRGGHILENVVSEETPAHGVVPEQYDDRNYQHLVVAQALPDDNDWHPIEVGVINLPQASVIMLNEELLPHSSPLPTAAASASIRRRMPLNGDFISTSTTTVVSSAPDESLLLDSSSNTAAVGDASCFPMMPVLEHLQILAAQDPTAIPVVLEDPGWKTLVQSLSPRDYCALVAKAAAAASDDNSQQSVVVVVARALAMQMGNHFQCRHILACLWTLANEANRIDVLCAISPLASDLLTENNITVIERELNAVELSSFRTTLQQL